MYGMTYGLRLEEMVKRNSKQGNLFKFSTNRVWKDMTSHDVVQHNYLTSQNSVEIAA